MDEAAMGDALGSWLAERLEGADEVTVTGLAAPRSGYSAETTVFDVDVRRGAATAAERYVLRRETPDPAVYPEQVPGLDVEVAIQWRAMSAVAAHTEVPIAPLVGFEGDPAVLGAPFFVMGHVDGEVPVEDPIYTREGFFVDATADQRAAMLDDGLRVLAAVHRMDWAAAGLHWLVPDGVEPGTARQLELWEGYTRRQLDGRRHPLLEDAFARLHATRADDPPVALSWGDPRPGNIIWRDFRAVCATDWEACSIAPPELDLGWWLMFDRWSHETMGVDRLPGEPTRAEQTARYEHHLGRSVGDTSWWELFAAARYAAIVVRVMNRMVARGDLPADQTIWLENPAVDCLAGYLAET